MLVFFIMIALVKNNLECELFFYGDYFKSGTILDIKLPANKGYSGVALKTQTIILGKLGTKEPSFEKEIDNVQGLLHIKNFAFIP